MVSLLWATLALAVLLYHLTGLTRRGRLPPGPTPLPLIGNLLSLRGTLHHTLARLAGVHGPVMALKLGLTTAVVVSTRAAATEAFTKHDRRLAARAVPDATRALGVSERSMIWLPSSDPLWKTLRGLVATNFFSPRGLANARGVREKKVREIVGYFRGRAGREVAVGHAVYGGMLNLVSSMLCSADATVVGAESAQGLRGAMEDIVALVGKPNVSDLLPFLRPLDLQGWRRWAARHMKELFRMLDDTIDRRLALASKDKHGDFLDSLLDLVSTGEIARDVVTTLLFDIFVAGSDTIAISIEWAMAELLRNPRAMAKARAEIDDALGGKDAVEEEDAAGLPYLQAVVKEAMRLHPVGPILLPHKAVEEGVEIGGYAVPKGATVIFNAWAIMRDTAAWERPHEFLPERFMAGKAVDFRGKDLEFIPFGAGRRLCPGLPMAERLMPFVLASLLHAFDWRLPDGVSPDDLDLTEKFTTANIMSVPLKAVLVDRKFQPII